MHLQSDKPSCGDAACHCAAETMVAVDAVPRINGVALLEPGTHADDFALRERAFTELLRQQAVQLGLLEPHVGAYAPALTDAQRDVIEVMLDEAVVCPAPTPEECLRYFQANKSQFVVGQAQHVRHILFAVTPGVNVHALAVHAEKALLRLVGKDVVAGQFEQLASELSNCPTSAHGGDLGWIGPHDCAPELANELFHQKQSQWGMGVHPRLVHTRFGFHIVEVLGRRKGKQQSFEQVAQRIAAQLTLQSRAKALHQYMSLLIGQAQVEGLVLEGADSPLVQ